MDFSLSIAERKIPPNQPLLMDVKKKEAWALGFSAPQASKKFRGMEQACSLCRSKIWMNHMVDNYHVLECYSMVLKQNIVLKILYFLTNLRVNSTIFFFICEITSIAVHKPTIVLAGQKRV